MNNLRIKIWNVFESMLTDNKSNNMLAELRYWRKLLGNIPIQISKDCKTARISKRGELVILEIGSAFAEDLKSKEDWIWVIGHELSHFTLGHLNNIRRDKPLTQSVWNYIFDVAIEVRMFRVLPFGAPFEFEWRLKPLLVNAFGKFAAAGAFLINPHVWKSANLNVTKFLKDRIADKELRNRAIKLYNLLYQTTDQPKIDYNLMVNELIFWLEGVLPIWMPVLVEGSMDGNPDWVTKTEKGRRGGLGTQNVSSRAELKEFTIPQIAAEISSMVSFDPENRIQREERVHAMTVMPIIGRRSATLLGAGIYPVFFKSKVSKVIPSCFRPQVYLDLSGSMKVHIPKMYGLISKLSNIIGDPLWCFAGDVVSMTIKQLKNGEVPISGGTSMEAVLRHSSDKGFRKIIVLGDGRFSESPEDIAKIAQKKNVEIALVLFKGSSQGIWEVIADSSQRTYAKKVWTVAK